MCRKRHLTTPLVRPAPTAPDDCPTRLRRLLHEDGRSRVSSPRVSPRSLDAGKEPAPRRVGHCLDRLKGTPGKDLR